MKIIIFILSFSLCIIVQSYTSSKDGDGKSGELPNVVFILADDIGLGDIAPYHRDRTAFHDYMTKEQKKHKLKNHIPLHKEGTPAQVAEIIS